MNKCVFVILTVCLFVLSGCRENALLPKLNLPSNDDETAPLITSPAEGEWFATDQAVTYCWELPGDVDEGDVRGFEVQFSNTPTPDGPWDQVRLFTETCWDYAAGHQCVHEALYWRVRIVFADGGRSRWAVSYHEVGTTTPG